MRLFDIEINGKTYKACCGLQVLAELQKKYGSLDVFEEKIAIPDGGESKYPDAEAVLYATKLFLETGNTATDGTLSHEEIEKVAGSANDIFALAVQLLIIYGKSIASDNEKDGEEDEKN